MQRILTILLLLFVIFPTCTFGGLLCYGVCQTGCNVAAVGCYATAGATFGAVTAGVGTPAAIIACNAALGTCMATACAGLLLMPFC
jgi:hypothetical protein